MRKAALQASILTIALLGVRAAAQEVQWRPAAPAYLRPAQPVRTPVATASPVRLGQPIALDAGQRSAAASVVRDGQLRPASFTGVSLAEPQPIVRGQSPELPPPGPGIAPPVGPYPAAPPPPPPPPQLPPPPCPPVGGLPPARPSSCTPRFWIDGEYLLWWVKSGPLPVPLVTNNTGAAVFGDQQLDYGALSGLRISAGYWFSPEPCWGIDGSVFFLSQGARQFSTQTNGSPPLFVNGQFVNGVQIDSLSQLWGLDVNALRRVVHGDAFTVDLLGGFRYLNLEEKLNIGTNTFAMGLPANTLDTFQTRSQFYGAQIGARLEYRWCRWSVDLTTKVALGSTYETSNITGSTVTFMGNGLPANSTLGGILAPANNSGRFHHSDFAAVYESTLNVSYRFNNYVRTFIGYNFLGWSSVARSGDQVSVPPDGRSVHSSSFWAQGLNFGVGLTF
jgi:hypothetical protein